MKPNFDDFDAKSAVLQRPNWSSNGSLSDVSTPTVLASFSCSWHPLLGQQQIVSDQPRILAQVKAYTSAVLTPLNGDQLVVDGTTYTVIHWQPLGAVLGPGTCLWLQITR